MLQLFRSITVSQRTGIEWTDSTWNPVTGCNRVSSGCDNCYAATLANRLLSDIYLSREPVVKSDATRRDPFAVRIWPERLHQPLEWKESRTVFVNSMSDLFHRDIPNDFIRSIFDVMVQVPQHIFQILTKRPIRAIRFIYDNPDLLIEGLLPAHIWIGTSVENQSVSYRIKQLQRIPSRIRFISCEPLLGGLNLDLYGIHWVIAGGESGVNRRLMKKEWVISIRDQCIQSRVPFFFKQWGGRTPKEGGRSLDGKLWDELPTVASVY
jgi:protein gp37